LSSFFFSSSPWFYFSVFQQKGHAAEIVEFMFIAYVPGSYQRKGRQDMKRAKVWDTAEDRKMP
jgi:hypothetical protein